MIEFALSVPLFLFIIWGLVTMVSLSRAKLQVAMVAHAVMREAAGGQTDEDELGKLGKAYAKAIGMNEKTRDSMKVKVGSGLVPTGGGVLSAVLPIPQRVTVEVSAKVPDSLRIFTGPVTLSCSHDVLTGTWKDPWKLIFKIFGV